MLEDILRRHRSHFYRIVPFYEKSDSISVLDLSENNPHLSPEIFENTALFSNYIDEMLQQSGARYGVGGYLENRNLYTRSKVFDATPESTEPRTLHLGLDIWGEAGTPVIAPLDGMVHSKGNHTEFGNYGATVILQHQLEDQLFFTLYGHLSQKDLSLQIGSHIVKGEVFAHFGRPEENGHWPPHLHFQIIRDLGDHMGDYPGVCSPSSKGYYSANCPNPDLMVKWK